MRLFKLNGNNKNLFFRYLFPAITVCILAAGQNALAQDELPLNLDQVENGLKYPAPLATKIKLLLEGVNQRKITFLLTPEIEKTLRLLGANNVLISAIRANAPSSRIVPKKSANTAVKNSLGMEFVLIPKGEFMMGADDEKGAVFDVQRPRHKVSIRQDFYLGKYEITQAQWKAVMGKNPSTYDKCGENCPVETVSWSDAKKFIEKLNQKNDGYTYRLPSEAEWEYAARAGTETDFYWGKDAEEKDYRFYASSNNQNPLRVGSFLPNGFGLYDMSGNVWEYCEDVWQPTYKNASNDGSANLSGDDKNRRIMRGGSFKDFADERRSDMRRYFEANEGYYNLGFRIVAVPLKP